MRPSERSLTIHTYPWNTTDAQRLLNTFDQAKEALRGLLAYDEVTDCQVCGIGRSEEWAKAHAVLAQMEEV